MPPKLVGKANEILQHLALTLLRPHLLECPLKFLFLTLQVLAFIHKEHFSFTEFTFATLFFLHQTLFPAWSTWEILATPPSLSSRVTQSAMLSMMFRPASVSHLPHISEYNDMFMKSVTINAQHSPWHTVLNRGFGMNGWGP